MFDAIAELGSGRQLRQKQVAPLPPERMQHAFVLELRH